MDVQIAWSTGRLRGDWVIARGGLAADGGIRSAILVCLFTDRRAPEATVLTDGTTNRRGWWGDTYSAQPWGSLLWTLNRAKKVDGAALLNLAADMCRDACQVLVDSGYVRSVGVRTFWLTPQAMGIEVTVRRPDGTQEQPFLFDWAWEGTA
jgi:phage gp46-like protein